MFDAPPFEPSSQIERAGILVPTWSLERAGDAPTSGCQGIFWRDQHAALGALEKMPVKLTLKGHGLTIHVGECVRCGLNHRKSCPTQRDQQRGKHHR
jgi:hypothetical protein